jgi:plasmid stabilization system protein ParE
MSRPIAFRPIARIEFDEAMAWYEAQRPGLGLEFKEQVHQFLNRIAENPQHFGKVRGEIRRAVLRRFPYTIHFLPETDRIIVMAVFHGKRDPRHLEDR